MSFYQEKNKIIYRRYRIIRKIIRNTKFTGLLSYRQNMLLIITCISNYNFMSYGKYEPLVKIIDYYEKMCIDDMYKRIKLEL